jgi:hypothetical protein
VEKRGGGGWGGWDGWGQLLLYVNFGLRKSLRNRKTPYLSRKLHLSLCQNAGKSNLSTLCKLHISLASNRPQPSSGRRSCLQAKFHGLLYLRKKRVLWRINLELESRMDAELQSQHKTVRQAMQPSVSIAQFLHNIHSDLLTAANGIIFGNVKLLSTPTFRIKCFKMTT